MNIDIVVPYVDEFDESWQKDFNFYKEQEIKAGIQKDTNRQAFAKERTRDWDAFRFFFRGVEKNCPWVHKVFLVVQRESQIPEWLDRDNPKLRIVYHDEFIPKEFLPTFSTLVIETFYHRIEDLSEYFIVCNDDFYFLNPIPENLFFDKDGIVQGKTPPRKKGWTCGNRDWEAIINNNNDFLEEYIIKQPVNSFFHYSHLPDGRVKSFEIEFIEKYHDQIYDAMLVSKFRHPKNLIPSLLYIDAMKYTNYGKLTPFLYQKSKYASININTNFKDYSDYQMVCFNDTAEVGDNFYACKENLLAFLRYKLHDKSSFEIDDVDKLKHCFGIISWLPDDETKRTQRIRRLNETFEQIKNIFGDVEYIIVAQNWKDYKLPDYVKAQVYNYDKLGILKARKTLGQHFLDSKYDYLIMCDDDIVLQVDKDFTKDYFFASLDAHRDGFMFLQYSWSLNLCAISKYIYAQSPMIDIDPEKGEGYEDTTYPWLLHYKHPDKEFKISGIKFVQNKSIYHSNHSSTWDGAGVNHDTLSKLTSYYVDQFKRGNFTINKEKANRYMRALKYVDEALWYGWLQKGEVETFLDKYR